MTLCRPAPDKERTHSRMHEHDEVTDARCRPDSHSAVLHSKD